MSGVEVVAAVSAVVSAFHGASELLKHIKDKRRKTRQALKEFEERQLQTSLESGEKQIGLRYAQDLKEFGDYMRVGDLDAHQRLQGITIEMQRQVIENLKMAAQHDNAIINLALLHEASITNKRDVIVTLDELKQRLDMRRIPRRIEALSSPQSRHGHISADAGSSSSSSNAYMSAVTIPSETDNSRSRNSFTNFFARKRPDSASSALPSSPTPDINFSPAFEQLARAKGTEDRALIMKDIDHIIDSYQGLHINRDPHPSRESSRWNTSVGPPQSDAAYLWPAPYSSQDGHRVSQDMRSALVHYPSSNYQTYPTFDPAMLDPQQAYKSSTTVARNPFPHMQTHDPRSRLSAASGSSSYYSDASSLNRNSSTSSQDSQAQSPLPLQVPSRRPVATNTHTAQHPQHFQDDNVPPSTRSAEMEASPRHPHTPSHSSQPAYSINDIHSTSTQIPYGSHGRGVNLESLQYSPYATMPTPTDVHDSTPHSEAAHYRSSLQDQENAEATLNRPRYSVIQNLASEAPGSRSTQRERSVSQSIISATTLATAPAAAGLRHASIAPSVASTDSSGSTPIGVLPGTRNNLIRQSTVQSGGSERMMDGRPHRSNNYWGFCKGSWTIREEGKKGLNMRNLPCGMYNTKEIWECGECTFQGAIFTAPHPTKKNKTQPVVDPRAHTSRAGIRFRWIFLAKSHVKKSNQDNRIEGSNYGCTLCCMQGNVSSIYGGVETLMNHIALCHTANLDEKTRKKVNCIIGRVARDDEDWDLNISAITPGA